jgi:hypothetical protein
MVAKMLRAFLPVLTRFSKLAYKLTLGGVRGPHGYVLVSVYLIFLGGAIGFAGFFWNHEAALSLLPWDWFEAVPSPEKVDADSLENLLQEMRDSKTLPSF